MPIDPTKYIDPAPKPNGKKPTTAVEDTGPAKTKRRAAATVEAPPQSDRPAAYAPFPLAAQPEPLRGYVDACAAAVDCDPAYVALPLWAALAAAIGNTRRVELKRGWTEPAILWTANIGESGTAKSPALDHARDFPRRRQAQARKRFAEAMAEYETAMEQYKSALLEWRETEEGDRPDPPRRPVLERPLVDNTTIEALAPILLENPRGVLMLRDELANWLSFDRYHRSPRGGGEAAQWLEIHGGRSITIDRKTGEPRTLYVPRAAVSISGGIQPGILRKLLTEEHRDNGLLARLLMACPPRRPRRWTDREADESLTAAVRAVYDRLWELQPVTDRDGEPAPVIVPLMPDAKQLFVAFVDEHGAEQFELDGDLAAAWSKLEGYAARLALVHHLVRWATGDRVNAERGIDAESIRAGIELARWFCAEARRIYRMLDEDRAATEARELIELIRRRGGTITARQLQQARGRWYSKAEDADAALSRLAELRRGEWGPVESGPNGGKPTRVFRLF